MTEESYKKLNELEMSSSDAGWRTSMTPDENSGGSIGMLAAGMPMQGGNAGGFHRPHRARRPGEFG